MLPGPLSEFETGTIHFNTDYKTYDIQTTLTKNPDFFVIHVIEPWKRSYNNASGKYLIYAMFNIARKSNSPNGMYYGANIHQTSITISFNSGTGIIHLDNSLGVGPRLRPTQYINNTDTEPINYRWYAGSFT